MPIRPIYIALFIFLVLGCMFGLMFVSQKESIQKPHTRDDGFIYKGFAIKYPTIATFLGITKDTVLTSEKMLKATQIVKPLAIERPVDSEIAPKQVKKNTPKELPDFTEIDTMQLVRIQYPDSNGGFIASLRKKLQSSHCRIIHYGDSQIEGDRITGYLRNRLQKLYGGNGPGFIPVKPVYNQIGAKIKPSKHWKRHAIFDPTQRKFSHRKYGSFMSISRFTDPIDGDLSAAALDSIATTQAWITIGKSSKSYLKFRRFTNIGLHYGNCLYPIQIRVYLKDKLLYADQLITDGKYHNYQIKTPTTPSDLKIELDGKVSADFYGLSLDRGTKIQIDNVAMRGSSGNVFTISDATNYSRMLKALKPKIILMQFGGNMVPYLKDSATVRKYAKRMVRQINWIRRRRKKMQFIFIGPTDMCTPINGKMKTYPLLPYFNATLKTNCLANDVAYWSMYHAMGGKGSMPLWVKEKMAAKDYMHFTWKGTRIISELFFTALYLDLKAPTTDVLSTNL